MTQLLDTFVTAFLAEQGRYEIFRVYDELHAVSWTSEELLRGELKTESCNLYGFSEERTRAECTRWIAKQAAWKAFEVMAIAVGPYPGNPSHQAVFEFLADLAAEPETTSGDAEDDHDA